MIRGAVTRLRRLADQHSGGGRGMNARRVSAAGLWHMGLCTCVGARLSGHPLAPVLHPTWTTGTQALGLAALAWLR